MVEPCVPIEQTGTQPQIQNIAVDELDVTEKEQHVHDEIASLSLKNPVTTTRPTVPCETDIGLWKEVSSDMQAHFIRVGIVWTVSIRMKTLQNLNAHMLISTASAQLLYSLV